MDWNCVYTFILWCSSITRVNLKSPLSLWSCLFQHLVLLNVIPGHAYKTHARWLHSSGYLLSWPTVSQWWTATQPTLHATQVSAFISGCCALLHMFVFHMVTALHCKSAPLQPPLSVCSSFTRYLWDHLSSISAWTSLGHGLPLCLSLCGSVTVAVF